MPQFAPFDYGDVLATAEGIKGARTRNALAQQQLDPMSVQNQLAQEQLTEARQGNVLAQQAGQRAQTQFDQQQREANTKFAYEAFTVLSQDPSAVNYYGPKLKEMGIIPADLDYSKATPEEIQAFSLKQSQALGKALSPITGVSRVGKYNPGDYTPESWAQFMAAGGQDKDASILQRYEAPSVTTVGGAPSIISRSGVGAGEVTPLSTPKAEATAKAQIASAVKQAEFEAKDRGETFTEYRKAKASLPILQTTVDKLTKLADVATYTKTGQAFDMITKELGFGATKGATARAKMVSIVDNQVLPLLRQTFGAAFTKAEGDSLRATMLDADAAPEQKKATLNAFIEQKMLNLQGQEAELGITQPATEDFSQMTDEQLRAIAEGR